MLEIKKPVPREEWIEARKRLLDKEKDFTRARDRLSAERRALPWVRVEEPYEFEGTRGKLSLGDLFAGHNQLIVYHFMFAPDWEAGCKSCSFWADNFERNVVHLAARDVTLVAISRAPLPKLTAFAKRLGWSFEWVSSFGTSFNRDYGVTFDGEGSYNYGSMKGSGEMPGISVFVKGPDGSVYHTYSAYSRGLDMMNAAYHYLDLVPNGRDEADGIMRWLRLRDAYGR